MFEQFRRGGWLLAPALIMVSCSQGDKATLTGPSGASQAAVASIDGGGVRASADGDVKFGTGALEIFNIRLDRQTDSGASILRQYANPGGDYAMKLGETIELWAEYRGVANPRLIVKWGDGTEDDFVGCGSCLLKHKYAEEGQYRVTVILDDKVSTTVTRTFTLTSALPKCASISGVSDGDSSFDDAETATFGPVDGANRLSFSCPSCRAHEHADNDYEKTDVFVQVHNPDTNTWSTVFDVTLDDGDVYYFDGRSYGFSTQSSVDRVRFGSDPGQDSTYHGWGDSTITVCAAKGK